MEDVEIFQRVPINGSDSLKWAKDTREKNRQMWPQNFQTRSAVFLWKLYLQEGSLSKVQQTKKQKQKQKKKFKKSLG